MNKVCVGVDNHSGKGGRSDTSTDSGRRKQTHYLSDPITHSH